MQAFFESREDPLYVGVMTSYPFPVHVHEDVELACVLSGSCTMQIDGETYHLQPGDFAVLFPLIPHSYDHLSDDCQGFAAFFLPDSFGDYSHIFHSLLPDKPIISIDRMRGDVRELIRTLMELPAEDQPLFRLAYLHLLLAHVLSAVSLHPAETSNERGLAARTIQYIYEHAYEKITLDSAARGLGISKSHLSHLFSQQFHINFRHFINGIRIHKALMQMRDPSITMTQICYNCGYENMRTFRRAFVQEIGLLPSDYMREVRTPPPGGQA